MTKWLKENVKFALTVVTLFSLVGGMAVDLIPMPAKASDLDKLANTVQQLADIQVQSAFNNQIRDKQSEIRAIKRDYSMQRKPLSQDSQITIDTLLDDIEELRWQRDNPR